MSVTIRLARFGKKFAPSYKIVVSNTRNKRNGRFLDVLGHYNPSEKPVRFSVDKNRYQDWVSKGAMTTKAVQQIIEGTYSYKEYTGKLAPKPEEAPATTAKEESVVNTEEDTSVPEVEQNNNNKDDSAKETAEETEDE